MCKAFAIENFDESFGDSYRIFNEKILQIGIYGPNVNKSFFEAFKKLLRVSDEPEVLDSVTCSIHPIHGAYRIATKRLSGI